MLELFDFENPGQLNDELLGFFKECRFNSAIDPISETINGRQCRAWLRETTYRRWKKHAGGEPEASIEREVYAKFCARLPKGRRLSYNMAVIQTCNNDKCIEPAHLKLVDTRSEEYQPRKKQTKQQSSSDLEAKYGTKRRVVEESLAEILAKAGKSKEESK